MKSKETIQTSEKLLETIENLFFDDPDFLTLKNKVQLTDKHIFQVICKEFDELTFSRTLKYFLDPVEEHNLGARLLRDFLTAVIKADEEFYRAKGITRLGIDLLDLDSTNVYREYSVAEFGRIDILAELSKEFELLIEVKLLSGEGDSQTKRYESWATEQGGKYKHIICCFLTPTGNVPESDLFTILSFTDLQKIFKSEEIIHSLNEHNRYIYRNFLRWIEELKTMDPKLRALCRNIYRKYKAELDLIINNVPSLSAFYKDVADYLNKNYSAFLIAHSGANWATISPLSWMKHKELTQSRKYSLPRLEYNSSDEDQSLCLVVPQEGKLYDRIMQKTEDIFHKDIKDVEQFKNWGVKYLLLRPSESFIPENIIDTWDVTVEKYGVDAEKQLTRIVEILTDNYLLE
jgi:hypothetical protein